MLPLKPLYRVVLAAHTELAQAIPELSAQVLILQLLLLLYTRPDIEDFWQGLAFLQDTPAHLGQSPEGGTQWQKYWSELGEGCLHHWLSTFSVALEQVLMRHSPALFLRFLSSLPELLRARQLRRHHGLYYTPEPLVRMLCQQALGIRLQRTKQTVYAGDETCFFRFCDPACGSGQLLAGMLAQLQTLSKSYTGAESWLNYCFGVDQDLLAVLLTRWRLWQQVGQPPGVTHLLEARIRHGNTLSDEVLWPAIFGSTPPRFELFIANPPYLGEKGHQAVFEVIRQGSLARFYRARSDLSYYFFHRVLDWSVPGAVSAFLTTSYYLTASQAVALRQDLQGRAIIHRLIDFHELRLFSGAWGQHNLITVFERGHDPELQAEIHFYLCKGCISETELEQLLQDPGDTRRIYRLSQQKLLCPQGNLRIQPAGLALLTPELEQVLARLQALPERLCHHAHLHQGLVSGADRLSAAQKRKFALTPPAGSGIFVLNAKEIAQLTLSASELQLLKPWYKNSDIQAWHCSEIPRQWLIYTDRQAKLQPQDTLWQYLEKYRPLLESRREVRQGRISWWQLHWPRTPEIFEGPKLVLPQRSQTCVAAWTDQPWYASADVYFITGEGLPWLAFWLNSPLAWLWLSCHGKRKGALLELYHDPLSRLPLVPPLPEPYLLRDLQRNLAHRQGPQPCVLRALWRKLCQQLRLSEVQAQALLQHWPSQGRLCFES